ncbi:MAG TPA: potassium channel family protein [Streptosporangiaceae bacterium]|nr:potassium channel family protein [Streptosporangiaceae bacterium]
MLLVILLASYLLSAFLRERWIAELELGLFMVAGLLALRNSPVRHRGLRAVISAGLLVSAVVIAISAAADTNAGHALAGIWTGILLLATVVLLLHQVLIMPTVTIQSIYGAVSAYLIIGLMFAAFYSAIYYLQGRAFFTGHEPSTLPTFQYFSFTTLTTLGYGDFTAAQTGGRAVAMIEAMTGQIFLATLVARLVAAFRPRSRQAGLAAGPANGPDTAGQE